jgi:hypothetical protein
MEFGTFSGIVMEFSEFELLPLRIICLIPTSENSTVTSEKVRKSIVTSEKGFSGLFRYDPLVGFYRFLG